MKTTISIFTKLILSSIFVGLVVIMPVSELEAQTINGKPILTGIWKGEELEYVESEILIKLAEGVTAGDVSTLLQQQKAIIKNEFDNLGIGLVEVSTAADLFSVINVLNASPLVEFTEPNGIYRTHATNPNDPYYLGTSPATYAHQWSLKNTGQSPPAGTNDADVDADLAWDIARGNSNTLIAILDTGIPLDEGPPGTEPGGLSHPDLDDANKFILGPDYTGDGDGVTDGMGHGTHVTGIASAETNNETGIAGVCWNCKILVIQVFDNLGNGTWSAFYNGMKYATDNGADIINFSGGGAGYSSTGELGVKYAYDQQNVTFVASSGNSDDDGVRYPARHSVYGQIPGFENGYSNTISVGATGYDDLLASYSSWTPGSKEVEVAAPGGAHDDEYPVDPGDIFSTMPDYSVTLNGAPYNVSQNYGYLPGTSMAAPHVAGLAGLLLSKNSSLLPEEVRFVIEGTADKVGGVPYDIYTGRSEKLGHGRVNANWALDNITISQGDPYYDDCGKLWDSVARKPMEPHRLQGQDFTQWGTQPNKSVSLHSSEVIYRYFGLRKGFNPTRYRLKVTYYEEIPLMAGPGLDRIQDIYIDGVLIDDNRNLPEVPTTYTFLIPKSTHQNDGKIDVKFKLVSGPNAVVSEIWVEQFTPLSKDVITSPGEGLPRIFSLEQNYPNPFNPETRIDFALPEAGYTRIIIYDLSGKEIAKLIDGNLKDGFHQVIWNAMNAASGIYFYRLTSGDFVATKKMVLLK